MTRLIGWALVLGIVVYALACVVEEEARKGQLASVRAWEDTFSKDKPWQ